MGPNGKKWIRAGKGRAVSIVAFDPTALFRGLGFRDVLGFRVLGFRILEFRVYGFRDV